MSRTSLLMSVQILIPTYNERANLLPLMTALQAALPDAPVLLLDDASPDRTAEAAEALQDQFPRLSVLRRSGPPGLGRAYLDGFRMALQRPEPWILCMDADLSHDPAEALRLLEEGRSAKADLVVGSRYLPGAGILNWPRHRLWLSRAAAAYTRAITGMPLTDPTSGFVLYRKTALSRLPLDSIHANGYAFQIEMKHGFWLRGFTLREVPIHFTERTREKSKMNRHIIVEAIWRVWRLAARGRPNRRKSS